MSDDALFIDSIVNFRGIGGLVTVDGRTTVGGLLWRSGHLGGATGIDLARLDALGIHTVVDLRADHDIAVDGSDLLPDGAVSCRIPIPDRGGAGAGIRAMIMRGDEAEMARAWSDGRSTKMAVRGAKMMVVESSQVRTFAQVFNVVANPANWPLVWHCSAGKDRAGWVGTALLTLLGVERDAVVDHYMESNSGPESRMADLVRSGFVTPAASEMMRPFVEVVEPAVIGQLDAIDEHWGGVESMFRDGFGFSDKRIAELRNRLLD
ncbi:MAG: tyrosine-protein phosphatase [Acidimicrobiales bacterium]|nr:tyrosine-protein phosphatase [Acidimicrobiales bacterium]